MTILKSILMSSVLAIFAILNFQFDCFQFSIAFVSLLFIVFILNRHNIRGFSIINLYFIILSVNLLVLVPSDYINDFKINPTKITTFQTNEYYHLFGVIQFLFVLGMIWGGF